jgi:demethylmenaquinone methyltransferase/2-methoxy-6-polyprenyl-1,4-benzoquinol methylase
VVTFDIVRPSTPLWGALFGLYFHHVVPAIGALVAGDRQAYTYLPDSVDRFPRPAALADLMRTAGLHNVQWRTFGLGTVALHVASA